MTFTLKESLGLRQQFAGLLVCFYGVVTNSDLKGVSWLDPV